MDHDCMEEKELGSVIEEFDESSRDWGKKRTLNDLSKLAIETN